ncbi:hypothetical protein L3X38_017477 [Prunus dulcis]|uniref:Uncharacterized protein n=1 Tax=Prunus dulcis TaxID=3755 RepID=A0AAD4W9T2_PRUDU|nr:hypothetical protein L3X38_017477 [Prunus dulcis]
MSTTHLAYVRRRVDEMKVTRLVNSHGWRHRHRHLGLAVAQRRRPRGYVAALQFEQPHGTAAAAFRLLQQLFGKVA